MGEMDKNYMNNKYNKFFLKKGQLQGTIYLEFKYCTDAEKFWNEDSYYIHGEVFEYLLPVFEKIVIKKSGRRKKPYYRLTHTKKGAKTKRGNYSNNRSLTHINYHWGWKRKAINHLGRR